MRSTWIGILQYAGGLLLFLLVAFLILKKTSYSITLDVEFIPLWLREKAEATRPPPSEPKGGGDGVTVEAGPCRVTECPSGTFSFSVSRAADPLVPPKICLHGRLVLGGRNNTGAGVDTVVLNGNTGKVEVVKTATVLDGDVKPLVEFLQGLEKGNIVLMTSYDDPATKSKGGTGGLNGTPGPALVRAAGDRDNWVLVGRRGGGARRSLGKVRGGSAGRQTPSQPGALRLEGCLPLSHLQTA